MKTHNAIIFLTRDAMLALVPYGTVHLSQGVAWYLKGRTNKIELALDIKASFGLSYSAL